MRVFSIGASQFTTQKQKVNNYSNNISNSNINNQQTTITTPMTISFGTINPTLKPEEIEELRKLALSTIKEAEEFKDLAVSFIPSITGKQEPGFQHLTNYQHGSDLLNIRMRLDKDYFFTLISENPKTANIKQIDGYVNSSGILEKIGLYFMETKDGNKKLIYCNPKGVYQLSQGKISGKMSELKFKAQGTLIDYQKAPNSFLYKFGK